MKNKLTWRLKYYCLVVIIIASVTFCSCSKTSQPTSLLPNTSYDTTPLPNTQYKIDTLNVVAYNILNYGDGCQGPTDSLDGYFRTFLKYAQPDLMSCEKLAAFPFQPGVVGNLADEIRDSVLNAVFAGRYAYATPTQVANSSKMSVLFYNKQKLTYIYTKTLLADVEDFDLYKLFYNDVNLPVTHDTTFLYVIVNHTQSGTASTARDYQVTNEMKTLRAKFAYLPNVINMGDFNVHSSYEAGYQSIISPKDSATMMSDPPFYPDMKLAYPANWDASPNLFAPYLTTSTRGSISIPNTCGTGDGAKSWYDHIFISPWLVKGGDYMQYIAGSYTTIGNDGNRLSVSINSASPVVNTSAPADVLDAMFQFSNKYPVSIKLLVKANRSGNSLADPLERN